MDGLNNSVITGKCPGCTEYEEELREAQEALSRLFDYVMVQEGGFKAGHTELANEVAATLAADDCPDGQAIPREAAEQVREVLGRVLLYLDTVGEWDRDEGEIWAGIQPPDKTVNIKRAEVVAALAAPDKALKGASDAQMWLL